MSLPGGAKATVIRAGPASLAQPLENFLHPGQSGISTDLSVPHGQQAGRRKHQGDKEAPLACSKNATAPLQNLSNYESPAVGKHIS